MLCVVVITARMHRITPATRAVGHHVVQVDQVEVVPTPNRNVMVKVIAFMLRIHHVTTEDGRNAVWMKVKDVLAPNQRATKVQLIVFGDQTLIVTSADGPNVALKIIRAVLPNIQNVKWKSLRSAQVTVPTHPIRPVTRRDGPNVA